MFPLWIHYMFKYIIYISVSLLFGSLSLPPQSECVCVCVPLNIFLLHSFSILYNKN